MIAIGIDPGVTTGIAVWDAERSAFIEIMSSGIISAMNAVKDHRETFTEIFVIVEDARKRGVFSIADRNEGRYGAGVREGVGSIKRDCSIWEEFLRDHGIPHEMRRPVATKMKAPQFAQLTGWSEQTNSHARDAAMIVFQLNRQILRIKLQTYKEQRERGDEQALHPRADRDQRDERAARAAGRKVGNAIRYGRRRR